MRWREMESSCKRLDDERMDRKSSVFVLVRSLGVLGSTMLALWSW